MSALSKADLLGTWELESFEVRAGDGRPPRHPFGLQARGRIVYAEDGHMMAVLSGPLDAVPQAATLETSHRASDAEKAAAFDRYLSYSGRWRLDGDQIHHDVDLALVPGLAGQTQTRTVAFLAGPPHRLTLSYVHHSRRGTAHRFVLSWRRPFPE